jgi:hypothetical protein
MYHEGLRRRRNYSADEHRRREKRTLTWLVYVGITWLAVAVVLICRLLPFTFPRIPVSHPTLIVAVLLAIVATIGGRFK